jgi:hypothetical protein
MLAAKEARAIPAQQVPPGRRAATAILGSLDRPGRREA